MTHRVLLRPSPTFAALVILSQIALAAKAHGQAEPDAIVAANRVVTTAQKREDLKPFFLPSDNWSGEIDYGYLEHIDRDEKFTVRVVNQLTEARVAFSVREDPFGDQEVSMLASFVRIDDAWVFAGLREQDSKSFQRWGKHSNGETQTLLSQRFNDLAANGAKSPQLQPSDLSGLPWLLVRQLPQLIEPEFIQPASLKGGGKHSVRQNETVIVELVGTKKLPALRILSLQQSGDEWLVRKATFLKRIVVQPNAPVLNPAGKPLDEDLSTAVRQLFLSGDLSAPCKTIRESQDLLTVSEYLFSAYRSRKPDRMGKAPIIGALGELGEAAEEVLSQLISDATSYSSKQTRLAAQKAIRKINSTANNKWPILQQTAAADRWDALAALLSLAPNFDDEFDEYPTTSQRLLSFDESTIWVKRLEAYLNKDEESVEGHIAIVAIRIFDKDAAKLIPVVTEYLELGDYGSAEFAAKTIIDLGQHDRKAAAAALTKLIQHKFDNLWDHQIPILQFLAESGADAAVALPQLERMKTQDAADANSIAVDGRIYRQAQETIRKIKAAK